MKVQIPNYLSIHHKSFRRRGSPNYPSLNKTWIQETKVWVPILPRINCVSLGQSFNGPSPSTQRCKDQRSWFYRWVVTLGALKCSSNVKCYRCIPCTRIQAPETWQFIHSPHPCSPSCPHPPNLQHLEQPGTQKTLITWKCLALWQLLKKQKTRGLCPLKAFTLIGKGNANEMPID